MCIFKKKEKIIYNMNLNYENKKTETIERDFIDNLNQIKEKLYYDKLDYQNQIKQLKQLCEFNFKNTYEKCEDIISKQEFLIKN